MDSLAALRRSYTNAGLAEGDLAADPLAQFGQWFGDMVAAGLPEPNAMSLATATLQGRPSVRTVLLKGYDEQGFVFYTNLGSRKAGELDANPYASLLFLWLPLERQVTVEGRVSGVSRAETEAYFHSRPRGSQLGAWASHQSAVAASRDELERRYAEVEARWPAPTPVPVPEFWGGFRLEPVTVEFWQGRPSRMHDRLRYRRGTARPPAGATAGAPAEWTVERLNP